MTHVDTCRHWNKHIRQMLIQYNTSECNIARLEHLLLQEHHWTAQMTSMMAQSHGNDKTDGTLGLATWTHTDEMAQR